LHPPAQLTGLDSAFEAAPIGLCVLDLNFRYLAVNTWFARMYGLTKQDFIGRTVQEVLPIPADQILTHLDRALAAGSLVEQEIAFQNPNASAADGVPDEVIYLRTAQPLYDQAGQVYAISVALLDITERTRMEKALHESEQHLRYTVELTPHIPWTADASGELIFISPRWHTITGSKEGPVKLRDWAAAVHPEDVEVAKKLWVQAVRSGDPFDAEYRIKSAAGGWRWVRARAYPRLSDSGRVLQWYGSVEDVDDRKSISIQLAAANAELERRAYEDHLTGLANRRHFDAALVRELRRATRTGSPTALIMLDVDYFKRYNDLAGHLAGDECLKRVAQEINRAMRRPGDLAARFGGEEFAIILPATPLDGALAIADRIADAVRQLVIEHPDPRVQHVTISAGVGLLPGGHPEPGSGNELIEAADAALYRAKANGRDRVEWQTL
jgi:diguanylate cyclase (GGDEF)-like protein/PAS domain S-box-containing protein